MLVNLQDICVHRQGEVVLDHIDLVVHSEEVVTLIGPNGAGKSTLTKIALRLIKPDTGQVWVQSGLRIGYVPQTIDLDPTLPISTRRFMQLSGSRSAQQIHEVLEQVGTPHLLDSPLQAVSGGELRRILLARALLCHPQLLILDEPTAGVDITGQAELYTLIQAIRKQRQCGILLISHDLHVVMATTDKVICLNRHLCCTGSAEHVQQHPEFIALFGNADAGKFAIYPHHHDHSHDLRGEVLIKSQPTVRK